MKTAVLGDTGMLGSMVRGVLHSDGIETVGYNRSNGLRVEYDLDTYQMLDNVVDPDVKFIINCVGAIKPVFNDPNNVLNAVYTNSIFPRELADWANIKTVWGEGDKLVIHITTDCVFDGKDGWYTENSPHNAVDQYGKSKSLGEPDNCMVIRTSIIGPEWGGNKRSLVEWFLSQRDGETNGFMQHMWNGLTTTELSRCISDIIWHDLYCDGVYHLFSNDISKYELLEFMNRAWGLNIKVNPADAVRCNRTLRTFKDLNSILQPQSTIKMLEQMTSFIKMDRTEYETL